MEIGVWMSSYEEHVVLPNTPPPIHLPLHWQNRKTEPIPFNIITHSPTNHLPSPAPLPPNTHTLYNPPVAARSDWVSCAQRGKDLKRRLLRGAAHSESQRCGWRPVYVTWLIHMCDVTHLYVLLDSLSVYLKRRLLRGAGLSGSWRCGWRPVYVFIYVTWLIHMCDMTHSYVWHKRALHIQGLGVVDGGLYMWHDSFICVTWLIHMCDMTHSYVWHKRALHILSLGVVDGGFVCVFDCLCVCVCVCVCVWVCACVCVCVWERER